MKRPVLNRAVIEGLAAVRSAAQIEVDSGDDCSPREQLKRGIRYIDELRAWFESRQPTEETTP